MSTEKVFLRQFAKLFAHYRDALRLSMIDDRGGQLERLKEAVEDDRMIAAARLALLEIENSRMQDNFQHPSVGGRSRNGMVDLGPHLQEEP